MFTASILTAASIPTRPFFTTLNGQRALTVLDSNRGRFASVTFVKRSGPDAGTERTMTVIFSRRYLLGAWRFDFAAKGLLPVFDVAEGKLKLIPLDGIVSVRAGGRSFSRKATTNALPAIPATVRTTTARPSTRPAVRTATAQPTTMPRRTAAEAQREAALLF